MYHIYSQCPNIVAWGFPLVLAQSLQRQARKLAVRTVGSCRGRPDGRTTRTESVMGQHIRVPQHRHGLVAVSMYGLVGTIGPETVDSPSKLLASSPSSPYPSPAFLNAARNFASDHKAKWPSPVIWSRLFSNCPLTSGSQGASALLQTHNKSDQNIHN